MKHLKAAGAEGAPMGELLQVLRDRSRGHVQRLINEIREEGRAHHAGPARAATGDFVVIFARFFAVAYNSQRS